MLAKLHAAGIPADISQTAGTFVCNAVFYALMHRLAHTETSARGGFVHISYLPEQAEWHPDTSSVPLETVVAGLRLIVTAAVRARKDSRIAAGATH